MKLNTIQTVAIGSAIAKAKVDSAKKSLNHRDTDAKTYPVDLIVRIAGTVSKSPDVEKPVPVAFDWQKAFVYLFSKVNGNMQGKALKSALEECVRGAAGVTDEMSADIKPIADAAASACVAATKRWTSGNTKFNGSVAVVADHATAQTDAA